ncbi:MAG: amine acid transporter, permease protein region, His/Glu/Gln/Arg/opine family [Bacillales bacterium]|nr:amine acid transporter, permease protein region, His/Glu/Gln/Arg/opine family [Bacillales bacterium]
MDFTVLYPYINMFAQGLLMTLFLSLVSVLIGIVIGFLVTIARMSSNKVLSFFAKFYTDFIRGTPILVQVFLFYFGLPQIGIPIPSIPGIPGSREIITGIIAISLNSSAYISEIYRSGLQSIDKGQIEAAKSLGLNKKQTLRFVTVPQAIRRVLPALFNEFITVTKESSIVSIVGLRDLMYVSTLVRAATYRTFESLIVIAIIYFILTSVLTKILSVIERKLNVHDQS